MKTDKHVYKIFAASPEWVFQLSGLPSPGECEMKSIAFKELEKTADGVIIPKDKSRPPTVVEFQFQQDPTIYHRTAIEMAQVGCDFDANEVQGVIFFRWPYLDPETRPWNQVIRACNLRQVLLEFERQYPDHPLVAVFQPVLLTNATTLEERAGECYRTINSSDLEEGRKNTLLDVFVSWLGQRLPEKGKQEIEKMLLGDLPDLRETQSGKDLIAIGVEEGKLEGKREDLITFLEEKFGALDASRKQHVDKIESVEELDRLLRQILKANAIDEMSW